MIDQPYQSVRAELESLGGVVERPRGAYHDLRHCLRRVEPGLLQRHDAPPAPGLEPIVHGPKVRPLRLPPRYRDGERLARSARRRAISCVDYLMFHELLHKKHGTRWKNGRGYAHTPAFYAEERRFPEYQEADAVLKRIASLPFHHARAGPLEVVGYGGVGGRVRAVVGATRAAGVKALDRWRRRRVLRPRLLRCKRRRQREKNDGPTSRKVQHSFRQIDCQGVLEEQVPDAGGCPPPARQGRGPGRGCRRGCRRRPACGPGRRHRRAGPGPGAARRPRRHPGRRHRHPARRRAEARGRQPRHRADAAPPGRAGPGPGGAAGPLPGLRHQGRVLGGADPARGQRRHHPDAGALPRRQGPAGQPALHHRRARRRRRPGDGRRGRLRADHAHPAPRRARGPGHGQLPPGRRGADPRQPPRGPAAGAQRLRAVLPAVPGRRPRGRHRGDRPHRRGRRAHRPHPRRRDAGDRRLPLRLPGPRPARRVSQGDRRAGARLRRQVPRRASARTCARSWSSPSTPRPPRTSTTPSASRRTPRAAGCWACTSPTSATTSRSTPRSTRRRPSAPPAST